MILRFLCIVFISLLIAVQAFALTIKVAVLVPEGTKWATGLKNIAKEVKKETNGEVKIKIYFGGAQGDEPDVLRKIRIGQLQGGVFSGKTLGDINGDVRVVEVPFTFYNDRAKAYSVVEKLADEFNQGFLTNGFVNLGFFEIGLVYFVSNKIMTNLDSLKKIKIWSWEGDPIVMALVDTMKLNAVPLPLPDVLTSLSTGIVEAAYSPPLGIVALQWGNKVKYVLDYPITFSIGAFLVDEKVWKKIPIKYHQKIRDITYKNFVTINKGNILENQESIAVLKSLGVKFISFENSEYEKAKKIRQKIINKLKGKLFSTSILKKLESEL